MLQLSCRDGRGFRPPCSTKIQAYRAVVVPTLLFGAETLVLHRKQIRLLERFYQRCLRSILDIKWQDRVSNEEVLKRAALPILFQVQLRWVCHVTRMEDVRMPKAVFIVIIIIINLLTARVVWASQKILQPVFSIFPVLHCPLGLAALQACPFSDVVFPPLLLSALSSSPFDCALQDGFGQT